MYENDKIQGCPKYRILDYDLYESFILKFAEWAKDQSTILGAVLVGSRARGAARADSDIDIVIVTDKPSVFLDDTGWLKEFGTPRRVGKEDYNLVQSFRVFFQDGPEVEFGITVPSWLRTSPSDPATESVLDSGSRILDDKSELFKAFFEARKAPRIADR